MLTNTKFPGHLKSPTENSRRDPAISPRDTEVRPLSAPNRFTMSYEAENTDIVRKWGPMFPHIAIPRTSENVWYGWKLATITSPLGQVFEPHSWNIRVYLVKLEEEILRKCQGLRKRAKEYITAMQYLPKKRKLDHIERMYVMST